MQIDTLQEGNIKLYERETDLTGETDGASGDEGVPTDETDETQTNR